MCTVDPSEPSYDQIPRPLLSGAPAWYRPVGMYTPNPVTKSRSFVDHPSFMGWTYMSLRPHLPSKPRLTVSSPIGDYGTAPVAAQCAPKTESGNVSEPVTAAT